MENVVCRAIAGRHRAVTVGDAGCGRCDPGAFPGRIRGQLGGVEPQPEIGGYPSNHDKNDENERKLYKSLAGMIGLRKKRFCKMPRLDNSRFLLCFCVHGLHSTICLRSETEPPRITLSDSSACRANRRFQTSPPEKSRIDHRFPSA